MADSKHTPGPWSLPHFAKPGVGCECGYVLTEHMMGAVCTVHASGEGDWSKTGDNPKFEEAVANAYLIAAAPAMLEALREMTVLASHIVGPKSDECSRGKLERALAAIAKATGSSDFHITERRA